MRVFDWIWSSLRRPVGYCTGISRAIAQVGINSNPLKFLRRNYHLKETLLSGWDGASYRMSFDVNTWVLLMNIASIFSHLRFIPSGHLDLPSLRPAFCGIQHTSYDSLILNPYLPFFNIWKPAVAWSKAKWDKGSDEGLRRQKPDFVAAVVEWVVIYRAAFLYSYLHAFRSRSTPLPSIQQLTEIFDDLPDEPKGPTRRLGPQYERKPRPVRTSHATTHGADATRWADRFLRLLPAFLRFRADATHNLPANTNPMGALRNGDRALIVAVNDSGNTGWVRFGRTGFAEAAVI